MQPFAILLAEVGLCASCAHCRIIESARGSRFYLCELGLVADSGFVKYPPLPMRACRGYESSDRDPVLQ